SYPPNAFGLYDMHGNAWEWTNDWYGEDFYSKSPVEDPQGPADGNVKVRRGGAWHTLAMWSRASFRNINTRYSRYPNLGFRDRKSTRLNSSHSQISYAVFCLKKKKKQTRTDRTSATLRARHYQSPPTL